MLKKTIIKYNSFKVSSSLDKAYISTIFSAIKSSIKSIISLLVFYNLFIFNTIIKNKKIILKYYRKKIVKSLFKVIYSLILNTYKVIIINLKLDLQSLYNYKYFSLKKSSL